MSIFLKSIMFILKLAGATEITNEGTLVSLRPNDQLSTIVYSKSSAPRTVTTCVDMLKAIGLIEVPAEIQAAEETKKAA